MRSANDVSPPGWSEVVTGTATLFQSRKWKFTAVTTFVAMNICILIVTLSMAVVVVVIHGSSSVDDLATHTYSLKPIQYWIVGVAGIAFLVDGIAVAASMVKYRAFRLSVLALLSVTIILTIVLAIWGSADGEARKSYFEDTWSKMNGNTKSLFEIYFSCSGFDGCYDRVTSTYLNAVTVDDGSSEPKFNPFYVAFVFCFVLLTITQTIVLVMFALALCSTSSNRESDEIELTITNPHTIPAEYSSTTNSNAATSRGTNVTVKPEDTLEKSSNADAGSAQHRRWWSRAADSMANGYADAFYWIGFHVAQHPKRTILYSLIIVACLSVGMVQRYESTVPGVEFLSENSEAIREAALSRSMFREGSDQFILIEADSDALSTANFMTALDIDQRIKDLSTDSSTTFSSICLRLGTECKQRSLFELWSFNHTALRTLTNSDILKKINENNLVSPVFGDLFDVSRVLGKLGKDSSNEITSARAYLLHYVTWFNKDWEKLFINVSQQQYSGVNVYGDASDSRREASSVIFTKDLPLLFIGFVLIFIYILLMTGKFSLIEHRIYIALLGVVAAGLSMSAGIGLTSSFGLKWTSIHLIVPFLVLGIGVDDMFVILQAIDAVKHDDINEHLTLQQKAGKALRNAGASITVTSVTDLVAFAVGATSELAAFASFSVFAAICIIILFFLECTFFLACVVLDERRKEQRYDACLACCYQHDENYEPSKCSQRRFMQRAFENGLGRIVTNIPFAVIVICITSGVTGLMAWGFYKLEVRFEEDWYIPSTSYVAKFSNKYHEYFNVGAEANVYVIKADFFNERQKLSTLYNNLRNNQNLNPNYTESWFDSYIAWKSSSGIDVFDSSAYANAYEFYADVNMFLNAAAGRKFQYDVTFRGPTIVGSRFHIRHRLTENQAENVDIVLSLHDDCDAAGFSDGAIAFPWGESYFVYEITRIIRQEVYRNIGITMLCVFLMVMPMLASVQMGFWVALCVVFTTVNVAGTMHFAGLSIEVSTVVTLLLSIGLAVDYAAHIGHKFLSIKGTRQIRTRVAVGQIGLAVFNGGFSTFLALAMLSLSELHTYKVFFTVFVCVVAYGLWTGLVFFPCVLAIVGPAPHANAEEARLSTKNSLKNGNASSREPISLQPETSMTTPQ